MELTRTRLWGDMPKGYSCELADNPLGTYWHLFLNGKRVNGGLADSEFHALDESTRVAWSHYFTDGGTATGRLMTWAERDEYLQALRDQRAHRWDGEWDD